MNDLASNGVSGPVVFNVHEKTGGYNELVSIPGIQGASSINTIMFQAFGNDEIVVHGIPSSVNNHILLLDSAAYIHIHDIHFKVDNSGSYGNVLVLRESSNNEFKNCVFESIPITSGSNLNPTICALKVQNSACDSNLFDGNEFLNGAHGIYFYGISQSNRNTGNIFIGNDIVGAYHYGAYFYFQHDLLFDENQVNSSSTFPGYGAAFQYVDGNFEVTNNRLCWPGYSALYCHQIEGTLSKPVLIANNLISSGKVNSYSYGAYISGTSYLRFVHNTVIKRGNMGYYGFYLNMTFAELYNNLFYDEKGSFSYTLIYLNGAFVQNSVKSDYNGFYSPNTFNLAQWQLNSVLDSNSIEANPGFLSCANPGPCNDSLNDAGTPLTYITTDIDGTPRDPVNPDIGAFEWSAPRTVAFQTMRDTFLCNGKGIILETPNFGEKYLWNTLDSTKAISITSAGSYRLEFTDYCGGVHNDSVTVTDSTSTASFFYNSSFLTFLMQNTSVNANSYRWVVYANPPDTFYTKDITYVMPACDVFYTVCLSAFGLCDTNVLCNDIGIICPGISENRLGELIMLFPNPTSNWLTIRFSDLRSDRTTMKITDLLGKQLIIKELGVIEKGDEFKVDASHFTSGTYFVTFITDKGLARKQLLILN
ncbi:MAG: T9SS type A sorting domain-containing protein [Vicingaceae bacterium]